MFPPAENDRAIRFSCGKRPVECSRLMLAMALSILVHAMLVLPESFNISARGGGEGSVSPHIFARLVDHRNGRSPEVVERVQVGSEKQIETTEISTQNQSDDIQPITTHPGKDYLPLPQESSGLGVEIPEMRYFSSDLLTVRPYPLTQLESPDLREPLQNVGEGRVVLRVWVSNVGEVTATETESTNLPIAVHEAVVSAFQRIRFKPGEIDGKPVGSILRVEMTYEDIRLSAVE